MEIFFRCFSAGPAVPPKDGMGQLAASMAARLPEGSLQLGSPGSRGSGRWRPAHRRGLDRSASGGSRDRRAFRFEISRPAQANRAGVTSCVYFDAPAGEISGRTLYLFIFRRGRPD